MSGEPDSLDLSMSMDLDGASDALPEAMRARYRLLRRLGRGGMGDVFLAKDTELDRRVAVKICQGLAARGERERFRREAEVLARVQHPNVLRIYDAAADGAWGVLVSELLEGGDLRSRPPERGGLEIMLQVAEGLQAIHDAGVLHRDLKPANILLAADGRPVLADFGLILDLDRTRLTNEGMIVGTLLYLAPEALRGRALDASADWYAWGLSLFVVTEGRLPFEKGELVKAVGEKRLPRLRFRRLAEDDPARRLIEACVVHAPEARVANLDEVRKVLAGQRLRKVAPKETVMQGKVRPEDGGRGRGGSATPTPSPSPAAGAGLSGRHVVRPPTSGRGRSLLAVGLVLAVAGAVAWWRVAPGGPGLVAGAEGPAGSLPRALVPAEPSSSEGGAAPRPTDDGGAAEAREAALGARLAALGLPADLLPRLEGALDGLPAGPAPDPIAWASTLEGLDGLRPFLDWLRADGAVEALPGRARKRLEALDAAWLDAGLPSVFDPVVGLRPPKEVEAAEAWARVARRCAKASRDEEGRAWQQVRATTGSGGAVTAASLLERFRGEGSLFGWLEQAAGLPERRREAFRAVDRCAAWTRAFHYASRRALRAARPEQRDEVGTALVQASRGPSTAGYYSAWAFAEPRDLLLRDPAGPWEGWLAAKAMANVRRVRADAGVEWREVGLLEVEYLRRWLEQVRDAAPAVRAQLLTQMSRVMVDLELHRSLVMLHEVEGPGMRSDQVQAWPAYVGNLVEAWRAVGVRPSEPDLAWLRAWRGGVGASATFRDSQQDPSVYLADLDG